MFSYLDLTIILFVVPQKFCISIVFNFNLGLKSPQEKLIKSNAYAKFEGTAKSIMVFLK